MINTQAIKERMREVGVTQAALAAAVGIATPTMNQKIHNIRPLNLDEAEKVARELRIADDEFATYFFAS